MTEERFNKITSVLSHRQNEEIRALADGNFMIPQQG
jgi:hypothetical protein